jgi:hypothetical protein
VAWLGSKSGSYGSVLVLGRKRPRQLFQWRRHKLVNVCRTEYLNFYKSAHPIVAGLNTIAPNPLFTNDVFVLWSTSSRAVASGITADRVRDLLGLVHHSRETRANLTLITFDAGTIRGLMRPTTLDAGPNPRFLAVCDLEWANRAAASRNSWMGFATDLFRIRRRARPYEGPPEGIAPATVSLMSLRESEQPLGKVNLSSIDDARSDRSYELYVRRGRTKRELQKILRSYYLVT